MCLAKITTLAKEIQQEFIFNFLATYKLYITEVNFIKYQSITILDQAKIARKDITRLSQQFLNQGQFCPPENIWQYLESFLVVSMGEGGGT